MMRCEDLVSIQSCDPSHSFPEGFQTAEDHVVSQPPASAHDASCAADTICGGIRYVYDCLCISFKMSQKSQFFCGHRTAPAVLASGFSVLVNLSNIAIDMSIHGRHPVLLLPASRASAHGGGGGGVASRQTKMNSMKFKKE